MTKCGIAFAILLGVLLPSSAWAVSRGTSCRGAARPQKHATGIALLCWGTQDPWQDCNEDPWQLSSLGPAPDTFLDPWQDIGDPWQPFVAESVVRDANDDPWQPSFADPWQDGMRSDLEDPWQ
jgi:hypothetical protein